MDEFLALAEAGATALVKAMATDLWPSTRNAVLALFRRERRAELAVRLDDGAARVAGAAAPDRVRRELLGPWTRELIECQRRGPACRAALAEFLGGGRVTTVHDQANSAADRGVVLAVQDGDQYAHLERPERGESRR
ncbi:hypothetical protein D5S18_26950 [Nocardia panacis]|uniref:Uncharacterized protein n=1 Tax=Nocardia panacis TaxID=2340916 RepID=A0A3A4KBJ4_9NOCA|nr:hypothetical protein [Nocardia panacis]RJO70830.1 hypothetical protein D5S18_26950 [Nocardia panacis]